MQKDVKRREWSHVLIKKWGLENSCSNKKSLCTNKQKTSYSIEKRVCALINKKLHIVLKKESVH